MQLVKSNYMRLSGCQPYDDSEWGRSGRLIEVATSKELEKRCQWVGVVEDVGTVKDVAWPYNCPPIVNTDVAVGDTVLFLICHPATGQQFAQELEGVRFGDPGDYLVFYPAVLGVLRRVDG